MDQRESLEFRKAMKAADPSIELLAVGHTDMEWNREVLSIAGGEMEYLTMHFYQGAPADAAPDVRHKAMLAAPQKYADLIAQMGQMIEERCKPPRPKIAVTEWNTMYLPPAKRTMSPREHTLEAALFNACYVATHTDRRIFIADVGNGRIVSVKLGYRAEEKMALKNVP